MSLLTFKSLQICSSKTIQNWQGSLESCEKSFVCCSVEEIVLQSLRLAAFVEIRTSNHSLCSADRLHRSFPKVKVQVKWFFSRKVWKKHCISGVVLCNCTFGHSNPSFVVEQRVVNQFGCVLQVIPISVRNQFHRESSQGAQENQHQKCFNLHFFSDFWHKGATSRSQLQIQTSFPLICISPPGKRNLFL